MGPSQGGSSEALGAAVPRTVPVSGARELKLLPSGLVATLQVAVPQTARQGGPRALQGSPDSRRRLRDPTLDGDQRQEHKLNPLGAGPVGPTLNFLHKWRAAAAQIIQKSFQLGFAMH